MDGWMDSGWPALSLWSQPWASQHSLSGSQLGCKLWPGAGYCLLLTLWSQPWVSRHSLPGSQPGGYLTPAYADKSEGIYRICLMQNLVNFLCFFHLFSPITLQNKDFNPFFGPSILTFHSGPVREHRNPPDTPNLQNQGFGF